MNYADLTSEKVPEALANHTLFLPVGSIEQHGPHLPLSVDVDIPSAIAVELADRQNGIIAPVVTYSARSLPHSGGGYDFPGTIYVDGRVYISYIADIIKNYALSGAKQIVVINGHYENESFLFEAFEICREKNQLDNLSLIGLSWWNLISEQFIKDNFGKQFPGWHAEHAGVVETSLMMHLKPNQVQDIRVDHDKPPLNGIYIHPIDSTIISHRGVLAKSTGSNADMGKKIFEHICDNIEMLLENPHGKKIYNN